MGVPSVTISTGLDVAEPSCPELDGRPLVPRAADNYRTLPFSAPKAYRTLSPFEDMGWNGDQPEVKVANVWYSLTQVNDLPVEEIVAFCKMVTPLKWKKRFAEDFVEVLTVMGHPPGESVALELVRLSDEVRVSLSGVKMTEENRNALRDLAFEGESLPKFSGWQRFVPHVDFQAQSSFPESVSHLQFYTNIDDGESEFLSRKEAIEDLDELQWLVENEYSYKELTGVDYHAALQAMRQGLPTRIGERGFALQIQKFLALFGDGHTKVKVSEQDLFPVGYLPFLTTWSEGRVIAFEERRTNLLDPCYPYVVAIDGRPIEDWLQAAEPFVQDGSAAMQNQWATKLLRYVAYLRAELTGEAHLDPLQVTLEDSLGNQKTLTLAVSDDKPSYGDFSRHETGFVGEYGYLRIPEMADNMADLLPLMDAMDDFKEAPALIIDVRGNGGGTRNTLEVLLPYFLNPEQGPVVTNAARYNPREILGEEPIDGSYQHLATRGLKARADSRLTAEEKQAIDEFAKGFRPEWEPKETELSDWHFSLVDSHARAFHFDKPVVILMDESCFSATDIFLGAFAELPGVTLVGSTSSGGSASARSFYLTHSDLRIKLGSIVSYRPNGQLYDGNGIVPDIPVAVSPTDTIGVTDSALEAVLGHLDGLKN